MKKILVVDFDQSRHSVINDMLKGHDVTHVYTYVDCVSVLVDQTFDVMVLNYEFDTPQASLVKGMKKSKKLGSSDLVVALTTKVLKEDRPKVVIVHSDSKKSAQLVAADLARAVDKVTLTSFDLTQFKSELLSTLTQLEAP